MTQVKILTKTQKPVVSVLPIAYKLLQLLHWESVVVSFTEVKD